MTDITPLQPVMPVGGEGKRISGWWGMWALIATEASLFGYLLFSFYYLKVQAPESWPPGGKPDVGMSGINTIILLTSSFFLYFAERAMRRGNKTGCLVHLAITMALGAAFLGIQVREWRLKAYTPQSDIYGSLYFTITGFHMLHVFVGLIVLALLWLWSALGYIARERHAVLSVGGLYWHFVDVVWLFIFATFFVVPYI